MILKGICQVLELQSVFPGFWRKFFRKRANPHILFRFFVIANV
jgi:hypothetical protein